MESNTAGNGRGTRPEAPFLGVPFLAVFLACRLGDLVRLSVRTMLHNHGQATSGKLKRRIPTIKILCWTAAQQGNLDTATSANT